MNKIIKILSISILCFVILISFNACLNTKGTSEKIGAEGTVTSTKSNNEASPSVSGEENTNNSESADNTTISETLTDSSSTSKTHTTETPSEKETSKTTYTSTSENTSEPDSAVAVYKMDCIINEIKGDHFVVEEIKGDKKSGILYQFNYRPEPFNEGDIITVEYRYPIAESFPYGLTNVVKIYKADKN